ncbi:MAG: family 16 glycosylhydrolase [Bacteroidota bacterium]
MKNLLTYCIATCLIVLAGCEQEPISMDPILALTSAQAIESDRDIRFALTLSEAIDQDLTINFSVSELTAGEGTDFESPAAPQVVIPAGATTGEIIIPLINDVEVEIEESFLLEITNDGNLMMVNNPVQGSITSDDMLTIDSEGFAAPTSYDLFTLVWEEEFERSLDPAIWNYETGTGRGGNPDNELQDYRSQNAYVQDGYLVIDLRQEPNGSYSSARIHTEGKREFQFGRIDIRAKLPQGEGIRSQLSMLGENFASASLPRSGGIDLVDLNGAVTDVAESGAEWFQDGEARAIQDTFNTRTTTFAEEFHVYSIYWEPTQITWYIDDVKYNLLTTTPEEMDEFRQEFFFVLGAAIGGDVVGAPKDETSFPQRLIVDYIRVYQE